MREQIALTIFNNEMHRQASRRLDQALPQIELEPQKKERAATNRGRTRQDTRSVLRRPPKSPGPHVHQLERRSKIGQDTRDGESHLARRLTMGTKTLDDIFMTWDTRSPREAGYLPRRYSLQKDARP